MKITSMPPNKKALNDNYFVTCPIYNFSNNNKKPFNVLDHDRKIQEEIIFF